MCVSMRHITSCVEKGFSPSHNAVNLVDGLHSLSKSLTECHYSPRKAARFNQLALLRNDSIWRLGMIRQ